MPMLVEICKIILYLKEGGGGAGAGGWRGRAGGGPGGGGTQTHTQYGDLQYLLRSSLGKKQFYDLFVKNTTTIRLPSLK